MSYRAWQNYFASDPSIVGSSIAIDGFHVTVVGIAPAEFFGDRLTTNPPDFWLPLAIEPAMRGADVIFEQRRHALALCHWTTQARRRRRPRCSRKSRSNCSNG